MARVAGDDFVGPADPPVAIDLMDWRLIASSHPDQWAGVSKLSLGFVGSFTSTTELVDSRPTEALEGRHQQYLFRVSSAPAWRDEEMELECGSSDQGAGTRPRISPPHPGASAAACFTYRTDSMRT
jgi:hypothetical protein